MAEPPRPRHGIASAKQTAAQAVHLHENDRDGIERLCRYGARGPLTLGRLSKDDDGRYRYRMKRTIAGKDELVFTGEELTKKLAVLIPPPRVHMTRFHGIFAPNAKLRALVVPGPASPPKPPPCVDDKTALPPTPAYRLEWAALILRVFAADVLECARCCGRMRVIAVIDDVDVAKKILTHLGMPTVPLDTAPARGPPQPSLAFEAA